MFPSENLFACKFSVFLFQPFGFSEACQTCERLLSGKRVEGVAWRCLWGTSNDICTLPVAIWIKMEVKKHEGVFDIFRYDSFSNLGFSHFWSWAKLFSGLYVTKKTDLRIKL